MCQSIGEVGDPFMKKNFWKQKSHNAEKNWRGDPSGFSNIHSVAKQQKKLKGDPLGKIFFPEKSLTMPKKGGTEMQTERGGPFGLARYGMLRGKTGKTFLVQFARPNGAIWCNIILYNFCRTILVSSGGLKKTLTKSHDYSRLFSKETRRLKIRPFD